MTTCPINQGSQVRSFYGGGSVDVDLLFIVAPIVCFMLDPCL